MNEPRIPAFALTAILCASCGAADGPHGPPAYLALGDSVAFGYNPLVDLNTVQVIGYPEMVASDEGLPVANASCPGEATGGFISSTGNDNHCRDNRMKYPLHVLYDGTQLDFALEFLRDHPGTELVTIDIGGNDLSKMNDQCAGDTTCALAAFPPMMDAYKANLAFIFGEIRKVYAGRLVALGIYNPRAMDSLAQFGLDQINSALESAVTSAGGKFADGMKAFEDVSGGDPCTAGLLIVHPDGTCDDHPSQPGHRVLADAVRAVEP